MTRGAEYGHGKDKGPATPYPGLPETKGREGDPDQAEPAPGETAQDVTSYPGGRKDDLDPPRGRRK